MSTRNEELTPSIDEWRRAGKRRRIVCESDDGSQKRLKSCSDAEPKQLKQVSETKRGDPPGAWVNQTLSSQSAMYAADIISSMFNITHNINFLLVGAWAGGSRRASIHCSFLTDTSAHVTWADRQSIIESQAIHIVDDLPHFLLLLLILQRFDSAKRGHFTECEPSGFKVVVGLPDLALSFVGDGEASEEKIRTVLRPFPHPGVTLTGRGALVIGGRWPPDQLDKNTAGADAFGDGNNPAVGVYRPEKSGTSEVEILKSTKDYEESTTFIGNHIPGVVRYKDPRFVGSSTSTIRRFLGLSTERSCCLRAAVSRRLMPIRESKEKDTLLAHFFCRCNCCDPPGCPLTPFCCRSLLPIEEWDPT